MRRKERRVAGLLDLLYAFTRKSQWVSEKSAEKRHTFSVKSTEEDETGEHRLFERGNCATIYMISSTREAIEMRTPR
jgi:hypothetical protein